MLQINLYKQQKKVNEEIALTTKCSVNVIKKIALWTNKLVGGIKFDYNKNTSS